MERSFPGAHADVGGGYVSYPEASYLPLEWMMHQGNEAAAGKMFDPLPQYIQQELNSGLRERRSVYVHDSRLDQHTGKSQLKYIFDWGKDFGSRKTYYVK